MAEEVKILTPEQEKFLELVGQQKYLRENFYLTGGTPLAAFYLFHRLSEDIDLFSEEEVNLPPIRAFIGKAQKVFGIEKVDYRQYLGLHTFQLFFSETNVLKVDFNYYPFPLIEKGLIYKGVTVDSALDIAVNKVHTIATKPRARDFIDIYFLVKEKGYSFKGLVLKAKAKFDWHIDSIQFGSRLMQAVEMSDFPRMLKPIEPSEWQGFFVEEARKLKGEIFEK